MKKTVAIILCVLMCVGCFAACGSQPAAEQTQAPAAEESKAPAENNETADPALEEEYYFTMGSTMTSSALITPLIAKACENINERTNGHVTIDFFPDSTLGNDAEMYSQMQNGELDFLNTGIMAKVVINDYAFLTGYWWMQDMDHFWAVWNSEIGERYQQVMENDYNTHQVTATLLPRLLRDALPFGVAVEVREEAVRRRLDVYFGDVYALKIVEKLHVNACAAYDEALFKVFRRVQRLAGAVHDQRAVYVYALTGDDDVEAVRQGLAARKILKRFAAYYDGGAVGKAAEMASVGLEDDGLCAAVADAPIGIYCNYCIHNFTSVLTVLRVFFRQKA